MQGDDPYKMWFLNVFEVDLMVVDENFDVQRQRDFVTEKWE
jgi:hypothetical protein